MATQTCAICLLFASFIGQYTQISCSVLESSDTGNAQRNVELDLGSVLENTGEEWNRNIDYGDEDSIRKQSDLLSMVMEHVHKKKNHVPVAPLLTRVNRGNDNLALYKQTWQSSLDSGGFPRRAVDGNRSPVYNHGSCTATEHSQNPWWAVDLGTSTHVTHVVLFNRQDCCSNRLNNAIVGLTQIRPDILLPALNNVHVCGHVPAEASAVVNVTCASPSPPMRFVTVLLPGFDRVLTLCEVQVFGQPGTDNLALYKQTWQSSVDSRGIPSRAVDGNMSPVYNHGSCTHTEFSNNPWWAVDLGTFTHVTHVVLFNRQELRNRLDHAFVGLTQTRPDVLPPALNNVHVCGIVPAEASAVNNVTCSSLYPPARVVAVLLLGFERVLTLCEVQVFGQPVSSTTTATTTTTTRTQTTPTTTLTTTLSRRTRSLMITADDEISELYVDGVAKSFAPGDWATVRVVDIPDNARVIAIKAIDTGGFVSGILASVDGHKCVTDTFWKCTTHTIDGWMSMSFDDILWPNAVISGTNTASDTGNHGILPMIHSNARWIWTSNHRDPVIDKTVYCRGNLG